MSGYNELKLEILEEADNWEEVTAGDMAETLGRTYPSIAMAMLRYHRQGLLNRYTINRNNEKVYSLTERGLERLEWLMEQASNDSDDDDMFDEEEGENEDEKDEADTEQDDDDFLKDYESLNELEKEIRKEWP